MKSVLLTFTSCDSRIWKGTLHKHFSLTQSPILNSPLAIAPLLYLTQMLIRETADHLEVLSSVSALGKEGICKNFISTSHITYDSYTSLTRHRSYTVEKTHYYKAPKARRSNFESPRHFFITGCRVMVYLSGFFWSKFILRTSLHKF